MLGTADDGRIVSARRRCLSGSALKLIACATMLLDHVAAHLLRFQAAYTRVLFSAFGADVSWYWIFRSIGRIAFPVYVFLLVEGFLHTRNRVRYGASLGAFALISEVPWDLEHFGVALELSSQNVFFTLLLGYLALCALEAFDANQAAQALALLACFFAVCAIRADYGLMGFGLILVTYGLKHHEALRDAASMGVLSSEPQAILAYPLLALYDGTRGFVGTGALVKYAFYAFYPIHLLIIAVIKMWLGYV